MNLTEKQLEVITQTVIECLEKEKEQQAQRKYDRRLRNVKLLLRNYRSFALHCSDIKLEIGELNRKLELDELDTDEFAVRSVLQSKEKTLAMVKFINKTLEVYKTICEQAVDPEEKRRYQVIYQLYISETKNGAKELALGHSVHLRTIYKDVDKACETLAVLMFGVEGLRFK